MTTLTSPRPKPARLSPADALRTGGSGLRTRPLRVFLSALGIAIGIAAMVGVVGISTSSQEELNRKLAALGTNLLTLTPGQTFSGSAAHLPDQSVPMVRGIDGVESVSAIGKIAAKVYRNDQVPAVQTGGISVYAARTDLSATVGIDLAQGRWLDAALEYYPAVVLGARAAREFGVYDVNAGVLVWLGDRWFSVVGVLAANELAPELDSAALVGWPVAKSELEFDGYPTTIYTRAADAKVKDVQSALGGTGGVALGIAVTAAYASYQHWPTVVPVWAMAGGVGATLVIGCLAGFYPAVRAARLPPTEALAAS
ncbi:ABC transporter permease [Kribbella solani]|uniref:ABC transporter permease n=1 Tax=Kribbella solani TaxID=236067 RepID=UPI0029AAF2E7|nr:ABC transporter permease [Kribbella solani]MDX2968551.1 ABC transporter permease [Kribbella solani]